MTQTTTITSIKRYWSDAPNIVGVLTSASLATITTNGYLDNESDNIASLNNGPFIWDDNDYVLIVYSSGRGWFLHDSSNATFTAAPTAPGSLSDTLADGEIFVGSALNVATGVAVTGDIGITNAGVTSISAGVIVNADVNAAAAIAWSKMAALTSAHILVGSGANVATDVAVTGDITLDNTGLTGIATGVIVNADVNAAASIAWSKMAALTDAHILVGSAANVATDVAVTGDVTISNAGVTAIGAGKVLSSMVSPLLMQYVAVSISAAEFNGMYAAPKQLVAAAGANTLITLHRAELLMTYGTTQFANGGVVAIQYDNTANGAGVQASTTQAAADFFDAASTANAFEGGVVKNPFTTCVNKGLFLSNITGAFDTGDSTFVCHLWYSVIPTV